MLLLMFLSHYSFFHWLSSCQTNALFRLILVALEVDQIIASTLWVCECVRLLSAIRAFVRKQRALTHSQCLMQLFDRLHGLLQSAVTIEKIKYVQNVRSKVNGNLTKTTLLFRINFAAFK